VCVCYKRVDCDTEMRSTVYNVLCINNEKLRRYTSVLYVRKMSCGKIKRITLSFLHIRNIDIIYYIWQYSLYRQFYKVGINIYYIYIYNR